MPCDQFTPGVTTQTFLTPTANAWKTSISKVTSPVLIVSNAPETLKVAVGSPAFTDATTLYRCSVPLQATKSKTFRVYLWHVNGYLRLGSFTFD